MPAPQVEVLNADVSNFRGWLRIGDKIVKPKPLHHQTDR